MAQADALKNYLEQSGMPTAEWWGRAHAAFDTLSRLLAQNADKCRPGQPRITIRPDGNFACGLSTPDDELECIAIGSVRKDLFVEISWQHLLQSEVIDMGIKPLEVTGKRLLLEKSGFTFGIRYFESLELARSLPVILQTPEQLRPSLTAKEESLVESLEDLQLLMDQIVKLPRLRLIYHVCRLLSFHSGLYGSKLACFDSHILRNIACMVGQVPLEVRLGHSQCRHAGIDYSSVAPWIISLTRTINGDEQTVQYLKDALKQTPWSFDSCVLVSLQFYGSSRLDGSDMISFVESKLPSLLKALGKLSEYRTNLWPTRLVDAGFTNLDNPYEGYYLLGLTELEKPVDTNDIQGILDEWNEKVRKDSRHSSFMTVSAAQTPKERIQGNKLQNDTRIWPRRLAQPDPKFQFANEKNMTPNSSQRVINGTAEGKFRPAMDVLNRLIHDPAFDLDDYVVGYLDRHSGIMEKAAREWVTESTDDQWIPQSRIQHFKRESDGNIVWDRARRRDLIFRS
ncbi:MAG: hypothetical protein M1818_001262 [Claussenomyces sp. TS43310]|nr:MAG: hypothetical protein M1818_001262 [Claussenomyces sp. TS43310]